MYTTFLVKELIDDGRTLIQKLEEERFPMQAAFWFQIDESEWRLIIASSVVDHLGPKGAYERLLEILRKTPMRPFDFFNITLLSPRSDRYKHIRQSALGVNRNGRIEDKAYHNAYVYRA